MKCDQCESPAVTHVTESEAGGLRERHYCVTHTAQGVGVPWPLTGDAVPRGRLPQELQTCQRCGAPTELLLHRRTSEAPAQGMVKFQIELHLCTACAQTEMISFKPTRPELVRIMYMEAAA